MSSTAERIGRVAVITGASSGLGRASAVEFARRGWRVALAARRPASLSETESLCRAQGADAFALTTDVTQPEQVERLVARVVDCWGAIDAWVNNAGVTLFARLEEAPFEEHRRVIETNLFGAMHCARAVVPVFRRQRRGVMINVGSITSRVGHPFVPSYAISKFAVRGLTEALRMELADEPDIHVCTLMPYAIDTQHFEAGANRIGREAYAVPPVQAPDDVARALVSLAERPRRERYVPRAIAVGLVLHALFPRTAERAVLHALRAWHLSPVPQRKTAGNLFAPGTDDGLMRGSRPPRIGAWALLAWLAADSAQTLLRRSRWSRFLRTPSHTRSR
jgi:NAD(P)-dependent dehydrogenase (short-subunit alcohol dehydrogenase family)